MQKNLFRLQKSLVEETATPSSLHYTLDIFAKVKIALFLVLLISMYFVMLLF
uniref:Uncharacterized protein n=1 Tax=Triticum urartu TaxID=4572 RepID=A0A8R7UQI6_TRIUA